MDEVFKALADPSRRLLLESLNERDGQSLAQLCAGLAMARQSVSKHLAVLEAANLVNTVRRGREKLHHLNAEPIGALSDRWLQRYQPPPAVAAVHPGIPGVDEVAAPEFRYLTYIRTTPERLWHAITNPSISLDCMGHAIESDWLKGSSYVWVEEALRIDDAEQVIVESDPYQRLAMTFHAFTPDLRRGTADLSPELIAQAAVEPRSRMVFDIEPLDDQVKLTLTHAGFAPGSVVYPLISHGWPVKLSNLKSELERAG